MDDISEKFRLLDLFSDKPNFLEYGDSTDPETREMYKTYCGSVVTVLYALSTMIILAVMLGEVQNP